VNIKKIATVADKTEESQKLLQHLVAKYDVIDLDSSQNIESIDAIVVIGGDGFMLHSLHRFINFNIPFYGINRGTVGFLLNSFVTKDSLLEKINNSIVTNIYPLAMEVVTKSGQLKTKMAINEVSLLRQTNQTAKIRIFVDDKVRMEEMVGDGIMVATPAGSSAYNFSVGGPIFPLDSKVLALTPISPFRPRRWGGALLPHKSVVRFEIIDYLKRPVSAVADFHEIDDAKEVIIKEDFKKVITLLFDPNHSLEDRIIKEQFSY
jgi:NAD+ kinase